MKIITAFIIIAFATIGSYTPSKADNHDKLETSTSALNTIDEIKTIDIKIKHLALENLNLISKWDIRAEIADERRSKLNQVLANRGEKIDVIEAQKELIIALYRLINVIIDVDNNKIETIELLRTINEGLGDIATVSLDIDKSSERKYKEAIDILNSLKIDI